MNVSYSLKPSWLDFVAGGKAMSEFEASQDNPMGLWRLKDVVRVGLKLGATGKPEFFAMNMTSGLVLELGVLSEEFGHGFLKRHIAHRALKPGAVFKKELGRRPPLPESPLACPFKCDDPNHEWSLLRREPFAVLKMKNWNWACYANFSPFMEDGHFLWLPVSMRGNTLVLPHLLQQSMTPELLEDSLALSRVCSGQMVFFNGVNAGASANHFHLQAVSILGQLPIEEAALESSDCGHEHLSGYPIETITFGPDKTADDVYSCIDALVKAGKTYNLMAIRRRTYLVPRNPDHEIVAEFPFGTLASMEMAGRFILSDVDNFRDSTWADVVSAFGKIGLSRSEIEAILNGVAP